MNSMSPRITVTVWRDESGTLRTVMCGSAVLVTYCDLLPAAGVRLPPLPGGPRGGSTGRRPGAACAR